jgi:hypothetical protein
LIGKTLSEALKSTPENLTDQCGNFFSICDFCEKNCRSYFEAFLRGCFEIDEIYSSGGTLKACLTADTGFKPFEGYEAHPRLPLRRGPCKGKLEQGW